MEGDRFAHARLHFVTRSSGSNAAWQIRRKRRESSCARLNNKEIACHRSDSSRRACRIMLRSVFGDKSSEGAPATVTSPGFFECSRKVVGRKTPRSSVTVVCPASMCSSADTSTPSGCAAFFGCSSCCGSPVGRSGSYACRREGHHPQAHEWQVVAQCEIAGMKCNQNGPPVPRSTVFAARRCSAPAVP